MAKLVVKDSLKLSSKKSMNNALGIFKRMEEYEKKLEILALQERLFWVNKGLEFYAEFYNKGINCEQISWSITDSIVDYLYAKDPDVKKEIDTTWFSPDDRRKKPFKASEILGDEFDVISVRDLFNAVKVKLEKEIKDTEKKKALSSNG